MNCKELVVVLILLTGASTALLGQNGTPKSFADTTVLTKRIPTKALPPVPRKKTVAKSVDAKPSFRKSLEVGTTVSVNLNLDSEGFIDTIGNVKVVRMAVRSDDAQSIGMKIKLNGARNFNDGSVFVYTPDRTFVVELVGKMSPDYGILLPFIPGDEAVVEINQPLMSRASIELQDVIHSEVPLVQKASAHKNTAQSCNIDVACNIASGWSFEKNAVVKICTSEGSRIRLCSGVLINNTARDKHPYLLTAHHCINNNEDANNSVFYFKYERPNCGSGSAPTYKTVSGAKLVASGQLEGVYDANLDFALLELSTDVPAEYDPYFAGWDIRKNPVEKSFAVCIHHPQGDVKKISITEHPVVVGDYVKETSDDALYIENSHWHVKQWDYGTTEGGSSGSPLFNADHLIIGTLTGGYSDCSNPYDDYYSMIGKAWDRYSDKTNQLKHWLDPDNLGDSICTGMTMTDMPIYITLSKNSPCVGEMVTMKVSTSVSNFSLSNIGADGLDEVTKNGSYNVKWSTSGEKRVTFSVNNSAVGEVLLASVLDNPEKPVILREGRILMVDNSDSNSWYFNDKPLNVYTDSIKPYIDGAYQIKATNSNGCSLMSDPIYLTFSSRPYADSLIVYPVPVVDGKVKVRTTSIINGTLTINTYSIRGARIGTYTIKDPSDEFEVELPFSARNGVYILEFLTKNGRASKKILVL